jgi:ABC-2 type transport system permease protein
VKPIILTELRRRRLSLFWWCLGVIVLVVLTLAFYPTIRDQQAELNKSFGNLSPAVTDLFSDTGEFFSPVGYLSSQIFYLMLPLILSMYAVGLGASLLAREEQSGTLELLLARPVSRTRVLLAKAAAGVILVGIVGLAGLLTTVMLAQVVDISVSGGDIVFTTLIAWLFSLILGGLAFALTAVGQFARRASIGLAALIGFAGYITTSFEGRIHWMEWVSRCLPFHYYHPADMLSGQRPWAVLICFTTVILIFGSIGIVGFRRRDIG